MSLYFYTLDISTIETSYINLTASVRPIYIHLYIGECITSYDYICMGTWLYYKFLLYEDFIYV